MADAVALFLEAEASVFDEEPESDVLLDASEVDPSADLPASEAAVLPVPFFA